MGRRSQHAPETLRRMIVDAAEAIVTEGGLSLLSAREIAKRIGYSPGTIYNVFENLDEVVLTVEGRVLDRLARGLAAVPATKPRDRLLALTRAYLAFTHGNAKLWNLLFEHRLSPGQDLPSWYMTRLGGLLTQIEAALEPYFAPGDRAGIERAARVLWSAVHGISSLSTSGKLTIITTEAAPRLADDLVRTYLAGLASSPAAPAAATPAAPKRLPAKKGRKRPSR